LLEHLEHFSLHPFFKFAAMGLGRQLPVAVALLSASATALRRGKEAVSPDRWGDIADAMKLPTDEIEPEISASATTEDGRPVFDFRAWGDEFDAKTFDQAVDHLNAYHQQDTGLDADTTTFKQRYWINTKSWAGAAAKAPIFVVISPYGGFNTYAYGFIGEMSRDMGAMVIMAEGRFSPGSLPFNESGFDKQANRIGLASSENALRDYVMLISHIRDTYDPEWVCPTGTYGTSLAGMYAAWLRYKFPNVFDFAVASGSPMTGYPGTSDTLAFTRVTTEAWLDESGGDESCIDLVRDSFKALEGHECSGKLWTNVYYEGTYYAYPPRGRILSACQRGAAKKAAGGSPFEVAIELCGSDCNKGSCPSGGAGAPSMWGYLSCTQVVNPIGSNGVSDFFWPPALWNTENRARSCKEKWDIEPLREGNYHADLFGWHRLSQLADSTSRILFAFGAYDAWTGFALSTTDISEELPVVVAPGGCHGSDLIGTRAEDTAGMLEARDKESGHVARWVAAIKARPAVVSVPFPGN